LARNITILIVNRDKDRKNIAKYHFQVCQAICKKTAYNISLLGGAQGRFFAVTVYKMT